MHTLPRALEPLTSVWEPRAALELVTRRAWLCEVGPMVRLCPMPTRAARRCQPRARASPARRPRALQVTRPGSLDELGVVHPGWRRAADVVDDASQVRVRRGAQLSVGDLRAESKVRQKRSAAWIFSQFEQPARSRKHLLNCIHALQPADTQGGARPVT